MIREIARKEARKKRCFRVHFVLFRRSFYRDLLRGELKSLNFHNRQTMLRKLFISILPVITRPQTCEACGEPFTCEIALGRGCWCADIKLTEQTRNELRTRYKGCLCRSCLEKEELKNSASEGSQQVQ